MFLVSLSKIDCINAGGFNPPFPHASSGIQVDFGLDPLLKHSEMTNWSVQFDLFAETRKVSREDGRSDFDDALVHSAILRIGCFEDALNRSIQQSVELSIRLLSGQPFSQRP